MLAVLNISASHADISSLQRISIQHWILRIQLKSTARLLSNS